MIKVMIINTIMLIIQLPKNSLKNAISVKKIY